jgi:hypothetical protein
LPGFLDHIGFARFEIVGLLWHRLGFTAVLSKPQRFSTASSLRDNSSHSDSLPSHPKEGCKTPFRLDILNPDPLCLALSRLAVINEDDGNGSTAKPMDGQTNPIRRCLFFALITFSISGPPFVRADVLTNAAQVLFPRAEQAAQ